MEYGIIVLLPPVITVVLALITKRPWEPLLAGTIVCYIISDGFGFFFPWLDGLYSIFDEDGVWLMLCVLFIGIFGVLLEQSKGTFGIANVIRKIAKTEKQSLILGWLLGIATFIDDYAITLTVSSTVKPLTDPHRTPRELLAYVTNSTAAPACIIIPLSSWYVFFAGLIDKEDCIQSISDGFSIYRGSIPYMFYGWAALILVPLVILGIVPKVGRMKKAYIRAKETGDVFSKESQRYNSMTAEQATTVQKGNPWNFIVHSEIARATTIIYGDLLIGLIWATAAAGILFVLNKTMTFYEWVDCLFKGCADMAQMFFIMMTALFVKTAFENIGLAEYVVTNVAPLLNSNTFPVIVFILVAALAFCTGNNWGVPAFTIPMVLPLAVACDANIYLCTGALLSGAAFGCNACFFSDTTVLTAKCCGISNMEHALSQLPYAVTAATVAAILFLIFGFVV